MKNHRYAMIRAAVLLAAATSWLASSAALRAQTPTLRADYEFDYDLATSVGTEGDLTELSFGTYSYAETTVFNTPDIVLAIGTDDTGSITAGGLQTPVNPFADGTSYSIVLLASFALNPANAVATKVFDFASLGSDAGIYINDTTGVIELVNGSGVPVATGANAAVMGTYFQLSLTRTAAGMVTAYMNGTQEFTYDDSTTDLTNIAPGNALSIFANDNSGVLGGALNESTEGDVARLQLYDGALTAGQIAGLVPEPSTMAMLVGGGLMAGAAALRRRRTASRC